MKGKVLESYLSQINLYYADIKINNCKLNIF